MRALVLAVCALALAACDFGVKQCTGPGQCPSGSECDQVAGFCFLTTGDSGVGGGGGSDAGGDAGADAGTDAGSDAGADAGVDAGVDAGTDAGMTCDFASCSPGQECDGDLCVDAPLEIVQVGSVPTIGPAGGTLAGRIQRLDGGVTGFKLPMMVSLTSTLTIPSTAVVMSDATFSFAASVSSGPDSLRMVNANFNRQGVGSVNGVLQCNVDLTAAVLTSRSGIPSTAQRDDIVILSLDAPEPVTGVTVRLGSVDGGVLAMPATGGCTGDAGCWALDMSLPTLEGLSGSFPVVVSVTDSYGNSGTQTLGAVQINRLRWVVQGLPATDTARASPAIGSDGRLYVGSALGSSLGSLRALRWEDGGIAVDATAPGAVESLATALSITQASATLSELVYFTANDTLGRVGARQASDLSTTGVRTPDTGSGTVPTGSGLALVRFAGQEIGAAATFNRAVFASRFAVFRPSSPASGVDAPDGGPTFNMTVDVNTGDVANNIIVSEPHAFLVTRPTTTSCVSQLVTGVSTSSPVAGRSLTLFNSAMCGFTAQSALPGGTTVVGGFTGALSVFRVTDTTFTGGDLGAPVSNGTSAVAASNEAYVGRGSDLIRYDPQQLMMSGVRLNPSGVNVAIRTSPVLGKARNGASALGYAVESTGDLWVFPLGGGMGSAVNYGRVVDLTGDVRAHPTLDCNRRSGAATSTTGILYVVHSTGKVAAVIVDSPKLFEASGAWPKYQRTAANAGNTDETTFALNPGCP